MKTAVHLLVNEMGLEREWFEDVYEMRYYLRAKAHEYVNSLPCDGMTPLQAQEYRRKTYREIAGRVDGVPAQRTDGYREGREYEVVPMTYARFAELVEDR